MKTKIVIFILPILAIVGLCNSFAQTNKLDKKTTVLFVGTFHFNNSGADIVNPDVDDVLSAKRQKEIAEVNEMLKKFAPTKIGIEQVPEVEIISQRYQQFLQGKYELGRNEIYQIGFRLGKDLGHQNLYQIDSFGTFPYGQVQDFAKLNGQTEQFKESDAIWEKSNTEFNEKLKNGSIRNLLLFLNDAKEIERGQSAYLKYARIGTGRLYPGVDLLTAWYQRNLRIFANITRMNAKPDDRILVLIGSGHLALLRQFAKESGDFNIVEVKDFLQK